MQSLCASLARQGKKIGLVPTMGFLHEGHIALVRRARKASDVVTVSIFVNPTQFGPKEDFASYPRDEKRDLAMLGKAGADIVFIPRSADIYGDSFQTYVNVEDLTRTLEGAIRPGHFRGVTTIVSKLFNIIRPDVAVFGMKDYQQAIVIKRMVRDLGYPIKILIAPTVREKSGLAMSSRNSYFTAEQRQKATCLYQALNRARRLVRNDGVTDPARLKREMTRIIKKVCPTAEIDYIAFTDIESLQPVANAGENCCCSLAVRVSGVRLIDNMKLT
jgi:pantoate--beta-alanine ligase